MEFIGLGWRSDVTELKLVGATGGNVDEEVRCLLKFLDFNELNNSDVGIVILLLFLDINNFVAYIAPSLLPIKAQ